MIAILFFVGIFVGLGFYAWKDRAAIKAKELAAHAEFDPWWYAKPDASKQSSQSEPTP